MSVLATLLCIAAFVVLAPLWPPLVVAGWFADLLKPLVRRLERLLGGRRRAAGALIVLLAVTIVLPLGSVAFALADAVRDVIDQLRAAVEGRGSLGRALLGGDDGLGARLGVDDVAAFATRFGANTWRALTTILRASATAAIGVLVFTAALYAFMVDSERAYAWLERHSPIMPAELTRLAGAFRETGRGLILGSGGTALVQGALATLAYVIIGIPRAFIFGALTAVCALIPFVGTSLIWLPLAIELALSGQVWRAAGLAGMGVGISVVDSFVRPVLTRYGRLKLPTLVVLVSMLGGIVVFGATGALLGPLVVRLAVESLAIVAERRDERIRLTNRVPGA